MSDLRVISLYLNNGLDNLSSVTKFIKILYIVVLCVGFRGSIGRIGISPDVLTIKSRETKNYSNFVALE